MGVKEKIKKKDDYKLLRCPFTALKDYCIADRCVSWKFTDENTHGYCVLIQDK